MAQAPVPSSPSEQTYSPEACEKHVPRLIPHVQHLPLAWRSNPPAWAPGLPPDTSFPLLRALQTEGWRRGAPSMQPPLTWCQPGPKPFPSPTPQTQLLGAREASSAGR